jgi:hypothetical protein
VLSKSVPKLNKLIFISSFQPSMMVSWPIFLYLVTNMKHIKIILGGTFPDLGYTHYTLFYFLILTVTMIIKNSYFYIMARRECFLCMKRSFTPRRRSRQYKPLNAQKHLRARNINNIFSIIDSKN